MATRWLAMALAATLAVRASAAGAGGGKAAEPDGAALVKGNSEFAFDLSRASRRASHSPSRP